MDLKDKTVVFLGSSVTYGSAANGYSMCEYIEANSGCKVKKWAVSGTTLADINENSYVSRLKLNMRNQEKCDLFICQLSTNDTGNGVKIGEISKDNESPNVNTVAGAIEYIVSAVKNKWQCPVLFYTGTYFDNKMYSDMVELLLKISEKWGFGVIDFWNDKDMRNISKQEYEIYMSDGVHPTRAGYEKWWGPAFLRYLEKA